MATLYLMLGYPGAGKTTTALAIQRLTGAVHLWVDQERRQRFAQPTHSHQENLELYAQLNQQANQLLAQGKSVIFDTNFNFYKDRQKLRQIAADNGADSRLIWVKTPKQLARERAVQQAANQPTRVLGVMPIEQFERITANLEPPRADEPYIEVNGETITDDYIKGLLA